MSNNFLVNISEPPKWFFTLGQAHAELNRVFKTFSAAVGHLAILKDVPKTDLAWMGGIKVFGGLGLLFNIPKFIKNINSAINATTIGDRIEHIANTILSAANITASVSDIYQALVAFGVVAKDTLGVFNYLGLILLPVQVVAAEEDVSATNEASKTLAMLKERVKLGKSHDLESRRIELLTESCKFVSANIEDVYSSLKISPKTKLDERIATVMTKIQSANAAEKTQGVAEGEELMKTLKGRAHTNFTICMLSTISKIAGIVAGIAFMALVVPMPIGWAVMGTMGLVALTVFGLKQLMLPDDPFAKPGDEWYDKMAHQMRQGLTEAARSVARVGKNVSREIDSFAQGIRRDLSSLVAA